MSKNMGLSQLLAFASTTRCSSSTPIRQASRRARLHTSTFNRPRSPPRSPKPSDHTLPDLSKLAPPQLRQKHIRPRKNLLLTLGPPVFFLCLFPAYILFPRKPADQLQSDKYSNQYVFQSQKLSDEHVLLRVLLKPWSVDRYADTGLGAPERRKWNGNEVVVQHVMVKNPDLMIERPYTPINNVVKEKEMKIVVKKVKGGEVGRMLFNYKMKDPVGMRGPITSFSLDPSNYDRIVMISTGTSVSPFLQFLSILRATPTAKPASTPAANATSPTAAPQVRSTPTGMSSPPVSPVQAPTPASPPESRTLPAMTSYDQPIKTFFSIFQSKSTPTPPVPSATIVPAFEHSTPALAAPTLSPLDAIVSPSPLGTSLHLIHAAPKASKPDWIVDSNLLLPLQMKHHQLTVQRFPHGEVNKHVVQNAVHGMQDQRLLVIVSLPPKMMEPLCGPMTATLGQGEVTGILKELGLRDDQVLKLA